MVSTQPNIACRSSLFVNVPVLRNSFGIAFWKNITACLTLQSSLTPSHCRAFTLFLSVPYYWQYSCYDNVQSFLLPKVTFKRESGTVSERVSVSSNRGTEWRLFECLCHRLPVVRETSCSIPSIGTSRHERRVCDGRRMLQSNLWAEGANELSALCRAFLVLFERQKVHRERLEENISLQQKG